MFLESQRKLIEDELLALTAPPPRKKPKVRVAGYLFVVTLCSVTLGLTDFPSGIAMCANNVSRSYI